MKSLDDIKKNSAQTIFRNEVLAFNLTNEPDLTKYIKLAKMAVYSGHNTPIGFPIGVFTRFFLIANRPDLFGNVTQLKEAIDLRQKFIPAGVLRLQITYGSHYINFT